MGSKRIPLKLLDVTETCVLGGSQASLELCEPHLQLRDRGLDGKVKVAVRDAEQLHAAVEACHSAAVINATTKITITGELVEAERQRVKLGQVRQILHPEFQWPLRVRGTHLRKSGFNQRCQARLQEGGEWELIKRWKRRVQAAGTQQGQQAVSQHVEVGRAGQEKEC